MTPVGAERSVHDPERAGSSPEVVIRDYASSDFDACRELWAELALHHRDIYEDTTIGGDDPGAEFERYLHNTRRCGPWVAELQGAVVGLTGLLVEGGWVELEPVIVASRHRGQGIGTLLVERAVQEAGLSGVGSIRVRPVARNADAIRFFARRGFDTVGHLDLLCDIGGRSERKWKSDLVIHGCNLRY